MTERTYAIVTAYKQGNSIVVSIPANAVKDLGIIEGDQFAVSLREGGLTYTKATGEPLEESK